MQENKFHKLVSLINVMHLIDVRNMEYIQFPRFFCLCTRSEAELCLSTNILRPSSSLFL